MYFFMWGVKYGYSCTELMYHNPSRLPVSELFSKQKKGKLFWFSSFKVLVKSYFLKVLKDLQVKDFLLNKGVEMGSAKSAYVTPFHLVEISPWPIIASSGALCLTLGSVFWWHNYFTYLVYFGLGLLMLTSMFWWRDVVKENMGGYHNAMVSRGLRLGMLLFMLSEVFFFVSFFWAYFHNCWGPQLELGYVWPPYGFTEILVDPFAVPLLNTVVLLSSGASMTWAHHSMLTQSYLSTLVGLSVTVLLGTYFLILQGGEYMLSYFSINSTVYGTVFFILTGFHGLHVTVGTMFLIVCLVRHMFLHFSSRLHVGFEAAAWYWHFVDIVWLFLYFFVYWYGFEV